MRSRGARLTLVAAVLLLLGASAPFLIRSEQQLSARRRVVRDFDTRAGEATTALAEGRAAQQAYVAAGQTADAWQPKVAALAQTAAGAVDLLRTLAATTAARASLMEAAATIVDFGNVDRRAQDYLASGQLLMAADVVFAEGSEVAAAAIGQIEVARSAEHEALGASEAAARTEQTLLLAAGAGTAALALLILGFAAGAPAAGTSEASLGGGTSREAPADWPLHRTIAPGPPASPVSGAVPAGAGAAPPIETITAPRNSTPALNLAAQVCTDIARARDAADLTRALDRAADAMDASGLVVWIATAAGGDLSPVLAHGYPSQTLARMTPVPRSGDNATAAAYRSGMLQIVLSRPGVSSGALVAPLLSPDGCIGALTAEIKGRGETSDGVQALATLVAAQLATVLAPSAANATDASDSDLPHERSATA